jgi:ABC-type transporter Mla MlaB component
MRANTMPFELQEADHGLKLILVGRLGVQQARPLWDAVQPALTANRSVRLEAGEVEEMDTSILQILCRMNGRTGQLEIGETSDAFLAALKKRGLEKSFLPPADKTESHIVQPPADQKARAARQGHG